MVKRQLLPSRHIVPVAFVSFAAPHAGVRNLPGAPSILSRVTRVVMQGVLGKTGARVVARACPRVRC